MIEKFHRSLFMSVVYFEFLGTVHPFCSSVHGRCKVSVLPVFIMASPRRQYLLVKTGFFEKSARKQKDLRVVSGAIASEIGPFVV